MISFVWSDELPLYSGRGGTETCTIGHVRELNNRGIPARIISIGLGKDDGREFHKDIPFLDIESADKLAELDDTIIYINIPHAIRTKHQSYVFLHCPPSTVNVSRSEFKKKVGNSQVITNSRYHRSVWADYLGVSINSVRVVYPFADPHFAAVKRAHLKKDKVRVLYAGRLFHEKGIYTFLEALHHKILRQGYTFTVTTAGNQTEDGRIIEKMVRCNPWVKVVKARHTPADMARLYARYDIVAMPSNNFYWHEAFGMVSVEAQHAGCRVVASNSAGLPETNCGELLLFEPGNSFALAKAIAMAAKAGPVSKTQRKQALKHFTRAESVDALLDVIRPQALIKKARSPRTVVTLRV